MEHDKKYRNKKGTLSFDLSDPDQFDDFISSLHGPQYKAKIDCVYDEVFRGLLKYENSVLNPGQQASNIELEVAEALWKKIYNHFSE